MYTQDIYYILFPKLHPYTSAGIPIHHPPMRFSPHDTQKPPRGAVLRRPHRRHRAGTGPVGTVTAALGLLIGPNLEVAGPSSRGHPGPLGGHTVFHWAIAPRPSRR